MSKRLKGKIKSLSSYRNFGYLRTEDNRELFWHGSDLCCRPEEGLEVEYELGTDKHGRVKAVNVTARRDEVSHDKAS